MMNIFFKEEIVICEQERKTDFLNGWIGKLATFLGGCVVREAVSLLFAKLHGE